MTGASFITNCIISAEQYYIIPYYYYINDNYEIIEFDFDLFLV